MIPSPVITDLVFFEPFLTPTQIVVGKMSFIGTALSALSGDQHPTIFPIVYALDIAKFKFQKVFPSDTATAATLSTFSLSAAPYRINFVTIENPRVAYSESSKTFNFTFFAYNSSNQQYLLNYKLRPKVPLWEIVDASILVPQNAPTL